MMLPDILSRCQLQMRMTPITTMDQLLMWFKQGVERVCNESQALQRWRIILCKAGAAEYLLPGDHQWTVAVYYDEQRLGRCTAFDAQLVSPGSPMYYHEDNWENFASESLSASMVYQHTLLPDLLLLQQAHSQSDAGRKTLTLVDAPTVDGTHSSIGQAFVGFYDGSLSDDSFQWNPTVGLLFDAAVTDGNIWLWYKYRDILPSTTSDEISYHATLSVLYMCATLELSLVTEDDEYDRYRSWLYGELWRQSASIIKRVATNKGVS